MDCRLKPRVNVVRGRLLAWPGRYSDESLGMRAWATVQGRYAKLSIRADPCQWLSLGDPNRPVQPLQYLTGCAYGFAVPYHGQPGRRVGEQLPLQGLPYDAIVENWIFS
jgi:hypothetical protein